MPEVENRSASRRKLLLSATVHASGDAIGVRCSIRNGSNKGCLLISSHVHDFPDTIEIRVDGIEKPIFAKIIWRSGRQAGVEFDWPTSLENIDNTADWLDLGASTAIDD